MLPADPAPKVDIPKTLKPSDQKVEKKLSGRQNIQRKKRTKKM